MAVLSDALKRVLNYTSGWIFKKPKYSGFYISNEQLVELGETLKLYNGENHPDGICFMVGKTNYQYSVEMIPYKRNRQEKEFHNDGENIGLIRTRLNPEYPGAGSFFINIAPGGGGTYQKTPPPRIGQ